jgi:hypothetical protein
MKFGSPNPEDGFSKKSWLKKLFDKGPNQKVREVGAGKEAFIAVPEQPTQEELAQEQLLEQAKELGLDKTDLTEYDVISTHNKKIFDLVKAYWKLRTKLPILDINLSKDYLPSQLIEILNKVAPKLLADVADQDSLITFFERIEGGKVVLAISVDPELDKPNQEINNFANAVRFYEQNRNGKVIAFTQNNDGFHIGELNEIVINGRYLKERNK